MIIPITETKRASPAYFAGAGNRARDRTWLLAALLGLGTLALYWPATQHAFVNYDDDLYVTHNLQVQKGLSLESLQWLCGNLVCGNWHPVTMFSHLVDCQLYGLRPWGHHFTSIGLHALNAMLLFLWLSWLTGARWRSAGVAALFAWHPLHVESVAWVAERKDVLSTCFGLLALLLYTGYARERQTGNQELATKPVGGSLAFYRSPAYWLAWGFFALGLLSKPMLVTWPFLLLLLDYWPLERFQPGRWRGLLIEKIPFFALAAAASVVTFLVQKRAGAVQTLEVIPLGARVGKCGDFIAAICSNCLAGGAGGVLSPARVLAAGLGAAGGPVPRRVHGLVLVGNGGVTFLLVGWLWFLAMLVPVIGLVQVGIQAMADRTRIFLRWDY